jgi:hypothetical protein
MADDVPAFDDIPSFDDLPDAAPQPREQMSAVPRFDDIPAFDDLPGGDNGTPNQPASPQGNGAPNAGVAPEGAVARGVRNIAHGVAPAVGGLYGAGLGAEAGGALGAVAGPIGAGAGAIVGGLVGAYGGAFAGEKVAGAAQDLTGTDDDAQFAANQQAHPTEAAIEQALPAFAGMRFDRGATLLARGVSAGMQGGIDAAQQKANTGNINPAEVAAIAALGAVFPSTNRAGEALIGAGARSVPGRPGRSVNPDASLAHQEVGDESVETAVGDSSLAESPPGPAGATVGTPVENKPTNSRGEVATGEADPTYAKGPAAADNSQVTSGDMDPATQAALAEANPATPPPAQPPAPPPVSPQAAQVNAQKPRISLKRMPQQPVVDAGFPEPTDPVAMGANDASPVPANMPQKAADAIAKSKASAPDIVGRAAEPTEAQKEAGNYELARIPKNDFGKPQAVETHAGQVRRGTGPEGPWENESPYHYGYFNKTKGPDGDHIDFARPDKSDPAFGDKHFIIDQKDATTGKYDEPKVFTYVKDKDTAIDLFNRGFSDGKGPDRMHDITEVSRGDLVKFLARHTTKAPKGPYGAPMPKAPKPVAERAVVKDLIAKGKTTPEEIAAMPPEQVEAAIAGKRTRKYGVKGGYPVEGVTMENGEPVTANTKAKAAERTAAHKAQVDWFEKSAPAKENETNGELLDRIKGAKVEGWVPSFKPKEWLLAREAKKTLGKPTPGNIQKFRDAERLLRGGDEAVKNYRDSNRTEADIAMSKRSGDEAVASAENAQHLPGRNDTEDALIEAIDQKRAAKPKFDVPHEEAESMVKPTPVTSREDLKALPRKTVHIGDSELAKIDLKKVDESAAAKRKAEAMALAGKKAKANVPSEEKTAGAARSIKISDPDKIKELIELSNKAAKRHGLTEEEINNADLTKAAAIKPSDTATVKRLFEQFSTDERGSLDLNKIKADLKKALTTTPVKSYIARTPKESHADYTRGLSDELHKISQADKSHRLDLLERARNLPKEADRDALERIYKAREADSAQLPLPAGKTSHIDALSPSDRAIYDQHLKPLFDENDQFYDAIHAIDPDRLGPKVDNHIARITKGDTSEYNMLKDRDDPTGPQYNGMSVNATMAHERPFVALENAATGQRHVIQTRDNGFTLWDKYKGTRIKDPNFAFEANTPYKVTNNKTKATTDYIMRHATADEIAANARGRDGKGKPMRYYQNAALSAAMTHAQMGSMARHLVELARISSTPEFKELTTTNPQTAAKNGWEESLLPNFKGTYMDPQLRYVMDDYAKPGFNWPQSLRDLNQAVTKLLFWMPTAHIANVGAHWFVGRGFDNLNVKRGFETSMKAIKSVMTQDAYQKAMRDAGAGTIYPSVLTRQFIEKMAKGVGEQFEKDPGRFGPIADKIGVPLGKVKDAIYNASSKTMWAANDMFLTQRVMELEQKGHSMADAIKMAERDIPNYRLPTTIVGGGKKGRILQQIMADPSLTAFGRYHYGMWNSYANIAKDAFGPKSTVGDRLDAVGKMGAAFVLAAAVYPVMDKFAKLVTGNDDASQNRRGPLAIPSHLGRALEGKEDIMGAARSTFTITPLISTVLETLYNKDFRGKNIVEPGDLRAAAHGDVKAAGRAVIQEGEHAARGLVSPLSTLETAGKNGVNPAGAVRDQALDVKNPSQAAVNWERKVPINSFRDANQRFKKGGSGLIEGAYDKAFGR